MTPKITKIEFLKMAIKRPLLPSGPKSGQKQCFLGKKRRFRQKNFRFWSRTVHEGGGGVPPFSVNFFSLTFRENVVRDGPGGGVPP